jgi:hypothetical protein
MTVVYFAPVFVVFFLGFYFNNQFIQVAVSKTSEFHWFTGFFIMVILFFMLGRILHEITLYLLWGVQHILHWLYLILYKALYVGRNLGPIHTVRKTLHQMLSTQHSILNELQKTAYLAEHPEVKRWYTRSYVYASSLHTALGASIALTFLYGEGASSPLIALVLILFVFTYIAKAHLTRTDDELLLLMKK